MNASDAANTSRTSLKTVALVVIIVLSITAYTKWQWETEVSHKPFVIDGSGDFNIYREDKGIGQDAAKLFDALDCAFHTNVMSKMSALQSELSQRWNIDHYPNFRTTMHVPRASWVLQKAKFVRLLLEANANHASSNTSHKPFDLSFVVGFAGSSVTAGHDNYFSEAFPQVFHDTLVPLFRTMEVPLVVRNHALGNNPCYPYDACIETHLGDDLDILAWEQSLNCGHWSVPLDTFSRQASYMQKKPTLLFITSGGPTWTRQDCAARNITTSAVRGPLSAAEMEILGRSAQKNAEVNAFLHQFTFLKDLDGSSLADRFTALTPMAQSIFGIGDYKCLGPYNSSFCEKTPGGGAVHHPGKLMHLFRGQNLAYIYLTMLEEAAQEVQQLTCPRPSGTTTSSATGDTMTIVQENAGGNAAAARSLHDSDSTLVHEFELIKGPRGRKMRVIPRAGAVVRKLVDHVAGKSALSGASEVSNAAIITSVSAYEKISRVLNLSLSEVPGSVLSVQQPGAVVSVQKLYQFVREYVRQIQTVPLPAVPINYNISEISHQPLCHTDYEPRVKQALSDIIVPLHSNWTRDLSFLDKSAVDKSIAKGYGYLDRKYVYTSTGANSTLSFTVRNEVIARLWLCEVQKGFAAYPSWAADLADGADVYIRFNYSAATGGLNNVTAGDAVSYEAPDLSKMSKLELKSWYIQCARTNEVQAGTHMVTLVQRGEKKVNLAYVVSWI